MDRDRIDRIDTYREIIKENIEFEALVHRYGYAVSYTHIESMATASTQNAMIFFIF